MSCGIPDIDPVISKPVNHIQHPAKDAACDLCGPGFV